MSLKSPSPGVGESSKFWVADDVGIELLDARYLTHRFVPHTHDEYSIGVILDGALGFHHERFRDAAPAGTVKAVNPGDVHTGFAVVDGGWRYRNFFVGVDVMRRAAIEVDGSDRLPDFPREAIKDPCVAGELYHLHQVLERSSDRLERESATVDALSRLIARQAIGRGPSPPVGDERPAVARVRELIENRFEEDLSMEELAATARLSPYHFLRVFRRHTGLTPHAYLLQVRVDHAKQMLAAGTPIAETSAACGFADQSHLTRRFKSVLGVTPGQYRKGRRCGSSSVFLP